MAGKLRHGRGWRIAELANGQHGVVGRSQLVELGVPERTIERWLAGGQLHRVHREVFALGHPRIAETGRRWAAVLAYGEAAVLSHRSAAAIWGLIRPHSGIIDVTATIGRQGVRRRPGIFVHRGRLLPEDRTKLGGLPVTTIARTLFDFAEVVSFRRLEAAWEEADRLKLLELRAIEHVCERGYGRRALKPIRRLLAEARAPIVTRSALEDAFAAFCRAHALPTPVFNTTVLGFEVDALWLRQRLIVELDGFSFHHHRAAFERDRARDAALQAAGYRIIRLTHRRLRQDSVPVSRELRRLLS